MNLFRHIPGYETHIYEAGKEALFLVFVSFLVALFLTRLYTRQARIRGWGSASIGGVHLHHAVPGVVLVLVGGLLSFTPWGGLTPAQELLAIAFGVGAAMILDEWALLFYLRDVYWANEGRTSIDAVIVGTSIAGILLLTTSPFEDADYQGSRVAVFTIVALNYVGALICFIKGKPIVGAIGLLIPSVALVGAIRLAKPHSPWSRWFYDPDRGPEWLRARRAAKLQRAQRRYDFGWLGRLERDAVDIIGGRPSIEPADGEQ